MVPEVAWLFVTVQFMCRMSHHAAQDTVNELRRQCDEAFKAFDDKPSDSKKQYYDDLTLSLRKAEDYLKSLPVTGTPTATGQQTSCTVLSYMYSSVDTCAFALSTVYKLPTNLLGSLNCGYECCLPVRCLKNLPSTCIYRITIMAVAVCI